MNNKKVQEQQTNNDRTSFFSPIKIVIIYITVMLCWIILVDYDLFNFFTITGEDFYIQEIFFLLFSLFFIMALTRKHKHEIKNITNYSEIVFSSSPSAIAIIKDNGAFISVNTAFLTLLGYLEKEIKHLNYFNLLANNFHNEVVNTFKSTTQINIQLHHKNGSLIDVSLQSKNVIKENKARLILFMDEVSLIKQLYKELSIREEKLSKIFDFMPVGMQLLNIESGKRINVNKKLCTMSGYSYEEFMVGNFFTHSIWQDDEQKNRALLQFKRDKKLNDFETIFITKQGKEFTVLLNAVMFNNDNQTVALIAINDISEQKRLIETVRIVASDYYAFDLHKNEQERYFQTLKTIANTFKTNYTLITQLNEKDHLNQKNSAVKTIETIANYHNEEFQPTLHYPLKGTPCEQVYRDNIVVLNDNVQQLFPDGHFFTEANIESYVGLPLFNLNNKVIGALVLLFTDKILLSDFQLNILQILAAKISNEIKHKENNAKLSRSEQHLQLYKEQAPLASIEWDPEFNIMGWNKAAEKMLGYHFTEIQKIDFINVLVPIEEREKITNLCGLLAQGIGGEYSVNTVITKQGEVIITEWHNQVIRNEHNEIIGITSIVINITEEQKAFNQLVAKEKDNQEILNTMNDAVFIINEQGAILSFNHAAETMFGYSCTQMLNEKISLLMPPITAVHYDSYIRNYLRTGKTNIIGVGREVSAQTAAGTTFPISLSIAELSVNDDGTRRFIGTCHDLTKIKQQQLLTVRFQKMEALGRLTGGVAHDFNNILGVISGYSELLNRQLNDAPKLQQFTEQILKASSRGAKLTKKLLSFSSNKSIAAEVTNINECLLSIEDMLQKTLTASITVKLTLVPTLWNTNIAINAFEDALLNLAINAKYAMPDGGSLLIKPTNVHLSNYAAEQYHVAAGDYVCINIEDSGCGMTEEVQQHLFDPFFTTKGNKGTGLGLAQVYGFIQASKGGINVYSELGKGSCFKLFLPRFVGEVKPLKSNNLNIKNKNSVDNGTHNKDTETILVVDDEPALTELAQLMLEVNGFYVRTANSAEQALQLLAHKNVDLLLSDIIMPTMSGYQLAKQVQQLYPDVLIVFASGFQGDDQKQKDQFSSLPIITKPYSELELLTIINQSFAIKHTKSLLLNKPQAIANITNISSLRLEQSDNSHIRALRHAHKKIEQNIAAFYELNCESSEVNYHLVLKEKLVEFKTTFFNLVQTNFREEEKLMKELIYPYAENHRSVHKIILKQLENFRTIENFNEIKKWLSTYYIPEYGDHVRSMDLALERFIDDNDPHSTKIDEEDND